MTTSLLGPLTISRQVTTAVSFPILDGIDLVSLIALRSDFQVLLVFSLVC